MNKEFIMSYSCGKDSTLALYRMIQEGYTPRALVVTTNKDNKCSWFHGLHHSLIEKVSKSLNIPLYFIESSVLDDFKPVYEEGIKKIVQETKANLFVFGQIDVADHIDLFISQTQLSGAQLKFPLWGEKRDILISEFIEAGFEAIITVVNSQYLSDKFLGKKITKELISEIKELDLDCCGENGLYHTFVYNGPLFSEPISFDTVNISQYNSYSSLELRLK